MSASTPTASEDSPPRGGLRRRPLGGGGWLPWLAAGAFGLAAFALFSLWTPSAEPETAVCMLRRTTGLPCPGCGMTRGLARLAKGDLAAAVALHPLAPWLVGELLVLWLAWGAFRLSGRRFFDARLFSIRWPAALLAVNILAFFVVWVVRWARGTLPW